MKINKFFLVVLILVVSFGLISAYDFEKFESNYLKADCDFSNNWCDGSDFNKDGIVNVVDFSMLDSQEDNVIYLGVDAEKINDFFEFPFPVTNFLS